MHLSARWRVFLATNRWVYWLAVTAIAVGLAAVMNDRVSALDDARQRWSDTRTVLVARHDHGPDDPLRVTEVDLPLAAVPSGALDPSDVDADGVARQRIAAGEILVAHDIVAPDGPTARAERGTVVVGIPAASTTIASIGLEVRIASEGIVLAPTGVVVDVIDDVVFVAVSAEVGAMVAHAAHTGTASLLFVPS